VKAKQLVESLLDDEQPEPEDRHERAYARLQKLYTRRGELQGEQMFNATWSMLLRRLKISEDNIKSLDTDQGKLQGIYLKQGDYGAKLARKAAAREKADAARAEPSYNRHTGIENPPPSAGPKEVSAFYVPISPPVYIPASVRQHWGAVVNPRA
jgi:hypothetical protein